MITDLIIDFVIAPFLWLLDQVPTFTWPSWFDDGGTMGATATTVGAALGSLANWIPVDALVLIVAAVIAAWAFSFAVQALRFAVSLFTGGGGNT